MKNREKLEKDRQIDEFLTSGRDLYEFHIDEDELSSRIVKELRNRKSNRFVNLWFPFALAASLVLAFILVFDNKEPSNFAIEIEGKVLGETKTPDELTLREFELLDDVLWGVDDFVIMENSDPEAGYELLLALETF